MEKQAIKEYIKSLIKRYGYSFIPLRLIDEGDVKKGKVPAISDWSKYCDETPDEDEIDNWTIYGQLSGIGICCGDASNICCVDIDTEDEELNRRISAIMPNTPRIIGNRKRGGKYLFRIREYPNDVAVDVHSKSQIKDKTGKPVVDLLISKSQIAVPPGYHTLYEDGTELKYIWSGDQVKEGEFPNCEDIPVLTDHILTAIKQAIDGYTPHEISYSLPHGVIDLDPKGTDQRYNYMKKQIAVYQRNRVGLDEAVKSLVREDYERHGEDKMVFTTKVQYTSSPYINAAYWYINQLKNNNARRPLRDCEVPHTLEKESSELQISEHEGWMKPLLPEDEKEIPSPFDLSVVPKPWRDLVKNVGDSNSVPYEVCFFILLTQLSAVIGNKKIIQPKMRNKSWVEAHNIWSIYVSRSGTRKTQLLRVLSEPMKQLQKRINDEYSKKEKESEKLREVVEPQIAELEKRLKEESVQNLNDDSNKDVIADIQMQIDTLKKSIEVSPKKQLIVKSATTEKLLELIYENQDGIMMVFNELTELLSQFKKKGYETHRQVLMNSWDGLDDQSYQTKNSGSVFIEKSCAALYGAVQQSMFKDDMMDIYNGKGDDGFWQRSFIVFNDKTTSPKAIDEDFDHSKHWGAYEIYNRAHDLEQSDEPIKLDYLAYEEFMDFEDRILGMANKESIDAIASFWNKFTGKVVKVSSLLEFISNEGRFPGEISLESMRGAIYIMERQMSHIRSVFPKNSVIGLESVIDLMKSGVIEDRTTLRQLTRSHPKYFGKADRRNKLIRELEGRNIIKIEKEGKSSIIRVSPYIF